MPTTTPRRGMRPDAIRSLIVALLAIGAFLVGCAGTPQAVPMAYACGTNETPPVALDRAACDAVPPTGRWYSGRADDLDEPDEGVVIGQPLDEDWWDPIAQADLDDVHPGAGHSPRASTPPPTRVRPSAPIPTTVAPAPSTRRPTTTTAPTTSRRNR